MREPAQILDIDPTFNENRNSALAVVDMAVYQLCHHAEMLDALLDAHPHLVLKYESHIEDSAKKLSDIHRSLRWGRRISNQRQRQGISHCPEIKAGYGEAYLCPDANAF